MADEKSQLSNQEGYKETEQNPKFRSSGKLKGNPARKCNRSAYYNMNHKHRGKALIFSHDHYEIDMASRPGTTKDCENLDKCLSDLGFTVDVFSNLRYDDIMKEIKRTAKTNHSKNDCLLIVVLTHGMPGMLYAKDTCYSFEKLWCHFTEENCPSLAGKPKLFFFHACQGEKYDNGITLTNAQSEDTFHNNNNASSIEPDDDDGWSKGYKNPTHPDFLLVLSTVPGYYAWRNTSHGSWFVQALCEELNYSAANTDILTILTRVSLKVALDFQSNTPDNIESHEKKQVPCISSMLTRLLVFTKKTDLQHDKHCCVCTL